MSVRLQSFGVRERGDRLAEVAERVTRESLDGRRAEEGVDGEAAGDAGLPVGREDMVRPGRVVAGGDRTVRPEDALLDRIPSAGSAFLGPFSPVAAGDYATGTNHVLPTNGKARVTGGLSVDTFLRSTTVQRLDRAALEDIGETVTTLARTEGLEAHAESVDKRFED